MLLWIYASKLPAWLNSPSRTISCCYPAPIGEIQVNVRSNNGSDAFIFSEVFDHRYYDFDLPIKPRTILDAGANVGFVTLFFARKYPDAQIASVEPMPGNVQFLQANLRNNGLMARVIEKALSVADGPINMQVAANDYGHKVAEISYGRTLVGDRINVEGISMLTLLAQLGWDRIGLLKLDIEGYEGVLLRQNCDWLDRVDSIAVECHEGFGESDLVEVARIHGFKLPMRMSGIWLLTR